MPQSYGFAYLHIVFGTKGRAQILTDQLHGDFARYITPILQAHGSRLMRAGGMPDHIHMLVDLGREVSLALLLREVKSKSSSWLRTKLGKEFHWQAGYGYFSVSSTQLHNVVGYIEHQKEPHRKKSFEEEFEELLTAAGVPFDARFLWSDKS